MLKLLTDRKLTMSAVFIFEIKGPKKAKIFNFLKGRFSVIGGPMDVIFGVFSDTKKVYLRSFFQNIAKVMTI